MSNVLYKVHAFICVYGGLGEREKGLSYSKKVKCPIFDLSPHRTGPKSQIEGQH